MKKSLIKVVWIDETVEEWETLAYYDDETDYAGYRIVDGYMTFHCSDGNRELIPMAGVKRVTITELDHDDKQDID